MHGMNFIGSALPRQVSEAVAGEMVLVNRCGSASLTFFGLTRATTHEFISTQSDGAKYFTIGFECQHFFARFPLFF